ncbi:helix-turn-helix domain-containing protein [Kitasatospora sp. NPDC127111]|uniref:AraC-like ligand-binding domain-containing protein n=1 Tax=Kitasatospora sp. NPDC127111 TaxID=3345363 RepID=UPI0036259464
MPATTLTPGRAPGRAPGQGPDRAPIGIPVELPVEDGGAPPASAPNPRGLVVSTRSVPARESLDFWRDAVLATLVGMDISTEDGTYDATMRSDRLGELQITTIEADAGDVHRSPQFIARGDGEHVYLTVQCAGIGRVEQDGRRAELRPGDLAFYETIRPYRTCFPERLRLKIFAVPRRLLGRSEDDLRRITGRALRPRAGLAALASPFMAQLADTSATFGAPVAERLARGAVDLMAALAAEQLGEDVSGLPGADRTLLLRVRTFIRWNLSDPGLTPQVIAGAHGISVRYLHKLFEREGTTVCRWIREQRLRECRGQLVAAAGDALSVGRIARRWGFTSGSHFSRAFRGRYGVSPTDWLRREQARRASGEAP